MEDFGKELLVSLLVDAVKAIMLWLPVLVFSVVAVRIKEFKDIGSDYMRRWRIRFIITFATSLIFYFTYCITYVFWVKYRTREMNNAEIDAIMMVGLVTPLITSIICVIFRSGSILKSIILGVLSVLVSLIYMLLVLSLYARAFLLFGI